MSDESSGAQNCPATYHHQFVIVWPYVDHFQDFYNHVHCPGGGDRRGLFAIPSWRAGQDVSSAFYQAARHTLRGTNSWCRNEQMTQLTTLCTRQDPRILVMKRPIPDGNPPSFFSCRRRVTTLAWIMIVSRHSPCSADCSCPGPKCPDFSSPGSSYQSYFGHVTKCID